MKAEVEDGISEYADMPLYPIDAETNPDGGCVVGTAVSTVNCAMVGLGEFSQLDNDSASVDARLLSSEPTDGSIA